MYQNLIKPLLDFVFALIGLVLLSPIFTIIALLLAIANNGKPFFFQIRPGKDERLFKIIKFKTMNDKKDKEDNLLSDEQRLTGIGRLVRKTSLDEIPQLINVLKGNMSFVGPRPLLPEYLLLYNAEQQKRHQVKPGITGWAQVNGRNTLSWHGKFEKDVEYVNKQSFAFDLKILWLTLKKVLKSEGINQGGQATAEKFEGNRHKT
jgi:lipopolysaccharide/colanic/teichoic acid biosynthesis glycosyltransferase